MPVTETPTMRLVPCSNATALPQQRVDLLGLDAGDGRRLVLRVSRRDRHLGPRGALALADELGDVLCQRLGAERRLAEDDLADRLVDDLLEARHVRALLVAGEIDEAVHPREEQLLADPDDLLDARHADSREAHGNARQARLDVVARPDELETAWGSPVTPAPRPSLAWRGGRPGPISRVALFHRGFWYHSALSPVAVRLPRRRAPRQS